MLKQILRFCILLFTLFFIVEFIMDYAFEEETPMWKLIAISMISAVAFIPILKRNNRFKITDYIKYQSVYLENNEPIDPLLLKSVSDELVSLGFKVSAKEVDSNKLRFSSKFTWSTFGERYTIALLKNSIAIKSRPKYFLDIFDEGQTHKSLNLIKTRIEKLLPSIKVGNREENKA